MVSDGSVRYSLQEPFDDAIAAICSSLRHRGIRIVGQVDISGRLGRSLGIGLAPCLIVFVLPDAGSSNADAIHPWAGVFLPLHVVISGNDSQSEVLIQNRIQPGPGAATAAYARVIEMQKVLAKAIEAVAARASLLA
jgi:uncharacterized protein (DUF302 family)